MTTSSAPPAGRRTGPSSPIQTYIDQLHERLKSLRDGKVATYIPPLAKADPDWFSICVATTDGNVYETGDSNVEFTIQSISKPFVYGLALQDHGLDVVTNTIGVEPTGDAFNSISLDPATGRPLNPMINAGAIAATSLVVGSSADDRRRRLLDLFSFYAGRRLTIDDGVAQSEAETGHRNRAIGHMLRNFDVLRDDPEGPLDLYFQQCSILVTCRDLALMAATLANGGVHPQTGETVTDAQLVPNILSIMTTCGMYDFAGEWAFSVGMPAKSGVAGGILAVLPGQLGIGIFSPPLDARGNSVRGVAACRELSREFNLHFLRTGRSSRSAVRGEYDLSARGSKRSRSAADRTVLDETGHRVKVYELQGDLGFSSAERVVRGMVRASETTDYSILDLKRVSRVGPEAARLFLDLLFEMGAHGKRVILSSVKEHSAFIRFIDEQLGPEGHLLRQAFSELDLAIEWCEDRLLEARDDGKRTPESVTLIDHPLCRGLSPESVRKLERVLEPRLFARRALLVSRGDTSRDFFILLRGDVSVSVDLPNGELRRLSTLGPGMGFGELALINGDPRSADVRADTEVECLVLGHDAFTRLGEDAPEVKIVLLENLLRIAAATVGRLTREVAVLAG